VAGDVVALESVRRPHHTNHTHKIRGPENLKSEPMCVPTTLDPDQLVT